MGYDRRAFAAGLASLVLCPPSSGVAYGQQLERSSLKLGVANKAHLYYLPLTLAERRGHFKDYGLAITISDFEGGGQSLEALLAGSVDVVTGAYEHTLHTQAKGQDIRAVIELGRFPGIVLAVGKDRPFKSHADLKGMKIGVTVPGSSSHFFVLYLMAKAGLAPADATFVGVGGGPAAVDAMKAGDIDAISNLDPVITRLQQDGAIRIITDSRFPRVNYEIFGGTNPAAVLYTKQEFIAANPNTMQALVNAFYKTLKWIATATTDEIVNTVPTDYFLGDRAIYVAALKANLLVYSKTGTITPALRHGKNVMKIHFLWILFWLYACDLAQSQTCMIRVLQVEGDKTVDSPLLLDGSKDVLVSIGRGTTIQGTAIKPASDPVTGRYAQDTAKELSVAFGSDEATARTRPMRHGDLWFLTARFIGLKIEKAQADPPQDALVQFCVFGVAPF